MIDNIFQRILQAQQPQMQQPAAAPMQFGIPQPPAQPQQQQASQKGPDIGMILKIASMFGGA